MSRISIANSSTTAGSSRCSAASQEPLTIVPEIIRVKGGDSVRLDVRITRHGPLISDAINANNAELPARPETGAARTAGPPMDRARRRRHDAAGLPENQRRRATGTISPLRSRDFVVPSQNFVYGDVDGHIGYYAAGRIPVRARGDGSLPVDGSSGER